MTGLAIDYGTLLPALIPIGGAVLVLIADLVRPSLRQPPYVIAVLAILKRAKAGAAIILSSHLLHLLEEVCSHVLILKRGEKIADGTIAEIRARFGNGDANANLEDVFIRATGGSE